MRPNLFSASSKAVTASLFTLAALSLAGTASAQTYPVYSESFSSGYVANAQLDTQGGWLSNDSYTGGQYTYGVTQSGDIGSSDFVGAVPNFSVNNADYAGFLGGEAQGTVPGVGATGGPVTLTHTLPTAGAQTVAFSTDFVVTSNSFYGPHDSFAINLTGTAGRQIGINFVVPTNNSTTADNVTYSTGAAGAQSAALGSIPLGTQRYKLTINVNVAGGTFGATLTPESNTGTLNGSVISLVPNGTTYGTGDITGFGYAWTLADQTSVAPANNPTTAGTNALAHTDPGSGGIYFDNIIVSIPEPSTYALLGLGAMGLVVAVRRSRLNRAA